MTNVERYLITTSDERTWKFDRPVIFLGEWCRLYNRRHVWEKLDAIVAEPFGMEIETKNANYNEARQIENILIERLTISLNQIHGSENSERFWKIIVGHSIRTFTDLILNRMHTLEKCFSNYHISGVSLISLERSQLPILDFESIYAILENDEWNSNLDLEVIRASDKIEINPELLEPKANINIFLKLHNKEYISNRNESMKKNIKNYSQKFVRKSDALIISSYLPIIQDIKLHLQLGQFPQRWVSESFQINENRDPYIRETIRQSLSRVDDDNKLRLLINLISHFLPVAYVESYSELERATMKVNWPSKPRFVFTSNNFASDEIFKCWVAQQVEKGYPYFVGQHGSSYGTNRFFSPSIEEDTSDVFLTWGWGKGTPGYKQAPILKTIGRKVRNNPKGGLLLIELPINYRRTLWDDTEEFAQYFDDQKSVIRGLSSSIKSRTTIRLHAGSHNLRWFEADRWRDFDPTLNIESGIVPINRLIRSNRLVVHSYDSTGILETLSMNIPTLAFWQNGLDHLVEEAKPFYQHLLETGIVHLTPESISAKICDVWDNMDNWWNDPLVQQARIQFCMEYAMLSKKPIRRLKELLTEDL